jgi:hypothetical protein
LANVTRTIADNAGFVPQTWVMRALSILRTQIVLARLITKDTDIEPGWKGKTLNIPYPGEFTAQDKAADTNATVQTPSNGASVAVTLSKHKYVDFIVEDVARAQSSQELLDRYVEPAAIALGDAVEDDLLALYSGLSTSVGTSGTDITASTIRSARKKLNDNKAPMNDRSLIISSKDEISVLGDSSLERYFASASPTTVKEGSIGRVYGFDVFMSQRVPVVAGTPNSTKNLAVQKQAFILATRPFNAIPQGSGATAFTVTDPATGLTIRVIYAYDVAARGTRVGFDILYGCAELRDACGTVVLS